MPKARATHGDAGVVSLRKLWLQFLLLIALIFRESLQNSIIIVEDRSDDCTPCYRRLFTGKKIIEMHVRRTIERDRIEDCRRACDQEKLFVCEGFNYRRAGPGLRGDACEMTSTSYPRVDVHRDFVVDPQCDFYEKDTNCLPNRHDSENDPSFWANYPSRQPGQPYGPPSIAYPHNWRDNAPWQDSHRIPDRQPSNEIPRPLDHDRRPTIEVPRPINLDGRTPPIYRVPSNNAFRQRIQPSDRGSTIQVPYDSGNYYPYGRPRPARPTYDNFQGQFPVERIYPKYPDRRMDYGLYNDIGTNEVSSYSPGRRKDNGNVWGVYSGVYGGSYGYDTNYVDRFELPKYYPKQPPAQYKPPHFNRNNHFYGEFYNYGGAFGYDSNYIPANRGQFYGGMPHNRECSVRAGAGFKLGRNVVKRTHLTPNLDQCESLCINEKSFFCMTFAYRYNVAPTDPTDNCLLSEVTYRDLNFYTDIEPDRDYDIYAMISDLKTCEMMIRPKQHPLDECFWRVRSGFGIPMDVTKKSIFVNGLGECQVECAISQEFTCRSFAFRYLRDQEQRDGTANCYLSDWPSQDINPANLPDVDGAELYERGSFGRGCEPYPYPLLTIGSNSGNKPPRRDEVCYSGYHRPCRLTSYAVLLSTRTGSENECRQKCSRMRERESVPCMSFSYRHRIDERNENCLLSDVPVRDLRPGLDYAYDDNHVLYSWKEHDPRCTINGYSFDENYDMYDTIGPVHGKPVLPEPPRPDFVPRPPGIPDRPETAYVPDSRPYHGYERPPLYDTDHFLRPYDPDRPDPVRPPHGPFVEHGDSSIAVYGNNGVSTATDHDSSLPFPHEFSTFQYYTVNGYPCKKGTKCERNNIAGFWSCETEGSEYGSWDYCCEPRHHCGYSQGYNYPWCYVGPSENQWRPCSEKYYPYLPSPRPSRPTVIDRDHGNGDNHVHPSRDRGETDSSYLSRHWPITYLHGEPPPNCTDSLASADNTAKNQRINESASVASFVTRHEDRNSPARTRTIRRRLRSRNATLINATSRDFTKSFRKNYEAPSIYPRKIDATTTTTTTTTTVATVDFLNKHQRAGKIERVSKPTVRNIASTVALPITEASTNKLERSIRSNATPIRVDSSKTSLENTNLNTTQVRK